MPSATVRAVHLADGRRDSRRGPRQPGRRQGTATTIAAGAGGRRRARPTRAESAMTSMSSTSVSWTAPASRSTAKGLRELAGAEQVGAVPADALAHAAVARRDDHGAGHGEGCRRSSMMTSSASTPGGREAACTAGRGAAGRTGRRRHRRTRLRRRHRCERGARRVRRPTGRAAPRSADPTRRRARCCSRRPAAARRGCAARCSAASRLSSVVPGRRRTGVRRPWLAPAARRPAPGGARYGGRRRLRRRRADVRRRPAAKADAATSAAPGARRRRRCHRRQSRARPRVHRAVGVRRRFVVALPSPIAAWPCTAATACSSSASRMRISWRAWRRSAVRCASSASTSFNWRTAALR